MGRPPSRQAALRIYSSPYAWRRCLAWDMRKTGGVLGNGCVARGLFSAPTAQVAPEGEQGAVMVEIRHLAASLGIDSPWSHQRHTPACCRYEDAAPCG